VGLKTPDAETIEALEPAKPDGFAEQELTAVAGLFVRRLLQAGRLEDTRRSAA
jgi:hypothetical protein